MTDARGPGCEALLLAMLLAAGPGDEAAAGPAITQLERIRAAVAQVAGSDAKEAEARLEGLLAQFPNFPNFPNFANFPNFPNFRNYR